VKVLLSWIRDFVDVPDTAEEIGARMSLRGLALEGLDTHGDDVVMDFDVTANRPDCLSVRGIAREIATAYQVPLKDVPVANARGASGIKVSISDPDLCARYVAAIEDVTIGSSPEWLQSRLLACGIRPSSNVVDVTNYVLLERGYPMHAFDHAKLAGPEVIVRRARAGERITTLDGKDRALDGEMLVIADATRAQAIGGVMGGAESEVSGTTTRIVFEAAWFKPPSVRATSKRLGLRTEASYRFERGVDLTGTVDAMQRALHLLEQIGAGRAVGPVIDCYPTPHVPRHLTVNNVLVRRFLGMDVPEADTIRILKCLGFEVQTLGGWQAAAPEAADISAPLAHAGHALRCEVPGWRIDVHRAVDVVEEIGRHYGFERLPSTFPAIEQPPAPSDPRIARDSRIRRALLAMGISEAITFAFIETAAAAPFLLAGEEPVVLANPLSEKFTTLRPSLLPGLIDAVSHNRRHGRRDVRLFEIGTRFSPARETRAVAVAWTGAAAAEHWSGGAREVDFFDVKGVVEQLGAVMQAHLEVAATAHPCLVDGRTAEVRIDGHAIGVVGQLAPSITEARDLPAADAVFVLEIDLDALTRYRHDEARFAQPLPRHPMVIRDIAILVADTLSAETVRGTIRAALLRHGYGGPGKDSTQVEVREFDRYQGKGIPEGHVSLALRLTFQAPDRTLTDAEVHAAVNAVVQELQSTLGATQR
jgi:phenylalanyl-tRNA synthetase beta chain